MIFPTLPHHRLLTPQGKASLCGGFEVVQLLLESGALCERDTFQGERCLYNALNDRIRNLLLSYDYSKSTDPLQPLASHITSLLTREHPKTSDILVAAAEESFLLHKFVLSARSPYFARKLSDAPDTTSWKLPPAIPPQAFGIAIKYIYFGEIPNDVGGGPGTGFSEDEVLEGIDRISRQLEIRSLWDGILESGDRRLARQRRTDEIEKGRSQLEAWFSDNVLKHKVIIETAKTDNIRWDRSNAIFADVLLRADEPEDGLVIEAHMQEPETRNGIPIGPLTQESRSPFRNREPRKSILFPVHRAMLLRSEYFLTMFSSAFVSYFPEQKSPFSPCLGGRRSFLPPETCLLTLEPSLRREIDSGIPSAGSANHRASTDNLHRLLTRSLGDRSEISLHGEDRYASRNRSRRSICGRLDLD